MSLEKLVEELSGGAAKLVSGKDAEDLLNNLQKAIQENAKGCGDPNCSVHGGLSVEVDNIDLSDFKPQNALQLAVNTAQAAQVMLKAGKYKEGSTLQDQSCLWLALRDALLNQEARDKVTDIRIDDLQEEVAELRNSNASLLNLLETAQENERILQAQLKTAQENASAPE